MFEIIRYSEEKENEWNDFVGSSKNGTFLFNRNYMDYHKDRFTDHSLMIYRLGRLYSLLPGNIVDDTFYSHQGLTYGGLLMDEKVTAADVLQIFEVLNNYLRGEGFHKVVYKPIPHIFHRLPSEEDLYSLFKVCHAQLTARSISSTIDLSHPLKWQRDRKYGINKSFKSGVIIGESDDWKGFWDVLTSNLQHKYGILPVHTIEEIELLHKCFPSNIRLFTATLDGRVLGGTVLYISPTVVHAQYISANAEGKHLRVIDALIDHIVHEQEWKAQYFDFGISTEKHGSYLNESLIYQKEGFGGRGICYDWYEWTL